MFEVKEVIDQVTITKLCDDLEAQLETREVGPEDVEERTEVLKPIERALIALPSIPQVKDNSAGKIAKSLWFKLHPQEANLELLLDLVQDDSALVRFIAVDALGVSLGAPQEDGWLDPRVSFHARRVLQESRESETSPIISYQLNQLSMKAEQLSKPRRRSRQSVVANPFIAGPPIREKKGFFGRRDILDQIAGLLNQGGTRSVILYGARRTGKTSLLYRIRDGELGSSFIPVYLDLQALAGTPVSAFLGMLLRCTDTAVREAQPWLSGDLPTLETGDTDFLAVQGYFETLLPRVGGACLVLMLDEYEVLQSYLSEPGSSLASHFQSLLEQHQNLFVIFAGSRKLEALRSKGFEKLLDLSRYIKISFLERYDAVQTITAPARGLVEFDEEATNAILTLTAGHPFYIQLLCQSVFEIVKGRGVITPGHVEEAVRRFMHSPSPHLVLTWNALEIEEEVAGAVLAELQSPETPFLQPSDIASRLTHYEFPVQLTKGEIQHALTTLRDIDWVEKKEGTPSYRLTMELVRRWVVENRSVLDLAEEYKERVLTKSAGFWRQRCAWLVDLVIATTLGGLLLVFSRYYEASLTFRYVTLTLVPIYFVISIAFLRGTLGMRLFRLRVVTSSLMRMGPVRSVGYGLLLTLRFVLFLSLLELLILLIDAMGSPFNRFTPIKILVILVAAIAEGLDNVMILFGRRHRGLYDKIARTIVLEAKALRES